MRSCKRLERRPGLLVPSGHPCRSHIFYPKIRKNTTNLIKMHPFCLDKTDPKAFPVLHRTLLCMNCTRGQVLAAQLQIIQADRPPSCFSTLFGISVWCVWVYSLLFLFITLYCAYRCISTPPIIQTLKSTNKHSYYLLQVSISNVNN